MKYAAYYEDLYSRLNVYFYLLCLTSRKNFENDEETSIDTSSSSTNQNPPYFVTTRLKSLSRVSLSTKKKKVTFQK